jgi:hypothetical protein
MITPKVQARGRITEKLLTRRTTRGHGAKTDFSIFILVKGKNLGQSLLSNH